MLFCFLITGFVVLLFCLKVPFVRFKYVFRVAKIGFGKSRYTPIFIY